MQSGANKVNINCGSYHPPLIGFCVEIHLVVNAAVSHNAPMIKTQQKDFLNLWAGAWWMWKVVVMP